MATLGKNQALKIDNSSGTATDLAAYLFGSGCDFGVDVDSLETTTAGDSSKTYVPSLKNATFSVEMEHADTAVDHVWDLYTNSYTGSIEFGPAGSTSTYNKYTMEAFVTSIGTSTPVAGLNTFTVEFQVTGDVTKGTY